MSFQHIWRLRYLKDFPDKADYGIKITWKEKYIKRVMSAKFGFGRGCTLSNNSAKASAFWKLRQANIFRRYFQIMMIGEKNAGSTSLLYSFKCQAKILSTYSTPNYNVEGITYTENFKNYHFVVTECGAKWRKMRWPPMVELGVSFNLDDFDAIVWVADSSASASMWPESAAWLKQELCSHTSTSPIVIVCNKQDLPGALTIVEISKRLDLQKLDRPWYILPCVAYEIKQVNRVFEIIGDLVKTNSAL